MDGKDEWNSECYGIVWNNILVWMNKCVDTVVSFGVDGW